MIREVSAAEALGYFRTLPAELQIASLSPDYVVVDAKRDIGITPIFLVYEEDRQFWLLSAHLTHVPHSEFVALSSPYGYGGPVSNGNTPFNERATKAYDKWAWDCLILAEVMKLHPLANHPYSGQLKFNRYVYNCGMYYTQKCRNVVNKAHRQGFVVEHHMSPREICGQFSLDYRRLMEEIGADPFYMFNDEYFTALSKLPAVCLVTCRDDLGAQSAAVFLAGANTMEYHLSVTNTKGKETGATNHLIHTARQALPRSDVLFLGGGRTPSPEDTLAKFKASFGGEPMPFNIGWKIHRPEVYNEMKQGNTSDRVLFWRQ